MRTLLLAVLVSRRMALALALLAGAAACSPALDPAGASRISAAATAAACGGDGQRACCLFEKDGSLDPCDPGLYSVAGCSGDCTCAGGAPALSHCLATPPCGADGQRACCFHEVALMPSPPTFQAACQPGVTEAVGCSGDCACGGIAPAITHCETVVPCGGEGERSCCLTELVPPCQAGLADVPGCTGHCACAGGIFSTDRHCERPAPCGGRGQRACCASEPNTGCAAGLDEVIGCSGDCSCPGLIPEAISMCLQRGSTPEPEVGQLAVQTPSCGLRGYADIHLHLFGHLGHGGGILAGTPYDAAGGIDAALRPDFGTFLDLVDGTGASSGPTQIGPVNLCPPWFPACGDHLFHGLHTPLSDPAGFGTKDGAASNLGAPLFNGWPRWSSTTHQQAYHRWLERAWRGGLRLTVLLAVSNESLCRLGEHPRGVDCGDSMASIDAQLAEARAFQDFVDGLNGGPGLGWFRIVESPAAARNVIRAGKLAVVLGIEVDNLFGCRQGGPCNAATVAAGVVRYRGLGVRHVFPIHNFDNAFGGAATWQDGINVGGASSEGRWTRTENCVDQGFGFWFSALGQDTSALLAASLRNLPIPLPLPTEQDYPPGDLPPYYASCNATGLTTLGAALVNELLAARMMVDVDHMSRRSLQDTLALAAARGQPLVASHVQAFERHQQRYAGNSGRHERMRTAGDLASLRAAGGLIGAMLKDDVQDTDQKGTAVMTGYGDVPNDCRHSSKSFAQAYQYAVDAMGGPVALGSDFNGIAGHLGPRFGSDACGRDPGERFAQVQAGNRLAYPFTLDGFGTFDRLVTGQRTFDFNVDGLAHVGLLPDLVADLKRIGLPQKDLDAIFGSAEAYVDLWERVEAAGAVEPRAGCVDRTVPAGASCQAAASVASQALQADPGWTLVQSPPGPYPVGTTAVKLTAKPTDTCSQPFTCTATVTVTGDQAPLIKALRAQPARIEVGEACCERDREDHGTCGPAMRPVTIQVDATEACAAAPPTCRITGVTSSQPPNGHEPDWLVTGPLTVDLRAEVTGRSEAEHRRSADDGGKRDGRHRGHRDAERIYSIAVECTDQAGHAAQGVAQVKVERERERERERD